jgi:AcrR family transcriptional regulator
VATAAAATPRAAGTAARRRRLLEAAAALAAEGGYDAVQMRDVAARAGVALGTLYRHYSSKDQLLLATLADQARVLRRRLTQRPPRGDSPAARVADALRRATTAMERQPRLSAAMVTALSSPDPATASVKQEIYDALTSIISTAADGEKVRDLDAVVRVLGHVWFSALAFWSGGLSDGRTVASDLESAARLLLE